MNSQNKSSIDFFKICFVNKESNIFVAFVLDLESVKFEFLLPAFSQILSFELGRST